MTPRDDKPTRPFPVATRYRDGTPVGEAPDELAVRRAINHGGTVKPWGASIAVADVLDREPREQVLAKFIDRYEVNPQTGCWEWTGARFTGGYALLSVDRSPRHAHRVAYELFVGPIPDGLVIDHLCVVAHCVNPSHLESVTQEENRRRQQERQTHCRNGHPLCGANLLLVRRCRTCARAAEERHVAKQKEARS